jgi:hypothetical protein
MPPCLPLRISPTANEWHRNVVRNKEWKKKSPTIIKSTAFSLIREFIYILLKLLPGITGYDLIFNKM